jgi:hypothetical protein
VRQQGKQAAAWAGSRHNARGCSTAPWAAHPWELLLEEPKAWEPPLAEPKLLPLLLPCWTEEVVVV